MEEFVSRNIYKPNYWWLGKWLGKRCGRNPFIVFLYQPSASSAAGEMNDVGCFTWREMRGVHERRTGANSPSALRAGAGPPALNKGEGQLESATCLRGRAGMRELGSSGTGMSCSGCWSSAARRCARLEPRQGCPSALPAQDSPRGWTVAAVTAGPAINAWCTGLSEERGGSACPGQGWRVPRRLHLKGNALGRLQTGLV